jgi:hypothetical protein
MMKISSGFLLLLFLWSGLNARETGRRFYLSFDRMLMRVPVGLVLTDTTGIRQASQGTLADSLKSHRHVERPEALTQTFQMQLPRTKGVSIFRQRWAQIGLVALASGLLAYMLRMEADEAYSKYLSADHPESMNHYFNRAVFYDKVSSGLFIFCEINFSISMWLSVRHVAHD